MALTDSFPGPNGLTDSIEAGKNLAGLISANSDGTPRAGILAKGAGSLITGRSDLRVDIAPFKAALVRNGAVRLLANDSVAQSPTFTLPPANSRIDVVYVKVNEISQGDATDGPMFGILEGAAAPIPTKPTLNIDGALELGTVRVSASDTGTAAAPIGNTAPFTAGAGGKGLISRVLWNPIETRNTAPNAETFIYEIASPAPIQAGETVRISIDGIGVFGGASGEVRLRYTLNDTAPTTASAMFPHGGLTRIGGMSGSVTTRFIASTFVMPSTAKLRVAVTFLSAGVSGGIYIDPFATTMSVE